MVATKSKSSSSSSPSATIKAAHVGKGSKRKKELSLTHNVINAKEEAIASAVLEVAAAAATNNTVVGIDDGSGDDLTATATATVVPTCSQTKLFSFDEKNNDVGAPATTSEPWYNILTKGDPEYNDYMANEWSFEKVCTLHVNAVRIVVFLLRSFFIEYVSLCCVGIQLMFNSLFLIYSSSPSSFY